MMFWEELFLDRPVPDDTLARALSITFGTALEAVYIVETVGGMPQELDDRVQILVERASVRGDFVLQVRIYIRDAAIEQRMRSHAARALAITQLCKILGANCLMSDDSLSSVTWVRVHGTGELEAVTLDADCLERDELVVVVGEAQRPAAH